MVALVLFPTSGPFPCPGKLPIMDSYKLTKTDPPKSKAHISVRVLKWNLMSSSGISDSKGSNLIVGVQTTAGKSKVTGHHKKSYVKY